MTESIPPGSRRITDPTGLAALRFDANGLIPVIAQDEGDGTVLMVAWANREALALTMQSGSMHYWSRSRGELWRKGATSGHTQTLVSLHMDCDADTLLARVRQTGPACHTGTRSCFAVEPESGDGLDRLWQVLESRARERPEGSYTSRLLDDENLRLKKLGEETAELVTALAKGEARASEEAADLLYHIMVALLAAGRSWDEVLEEMARRAG